MIVLTLVCDGAVDCPSLCARNSSPIWRATAEEIPAGASTMTDDLLLMAERRGWTIADNVGPAGSHYCPLHVPS